MNKHNIETTSPSDCLSCTHKERVFLDKLKKAKLLMLTVIDSEGIVSFESDFTEIKDESN